MANIILICVVLVISMCGLALGSRTNPFSRNDRVTMSRMVPDADDGICKLRVEIFGYVCEELVTTQDGYILSMQRIPVGKSGETSGVRPLVLLQHGVLMDGITWLLNTPDQSLAYILADNGLPIRVAQNLAVDTHRSPYWDWTWDQLVQYELPATFHYVHDQTNQKIHYVGHSLAVTDLLKAYCKDPTINCYDLMTTFTGKNCCLNSSTVDVFLENEPQSTATKNMIHLAQMIREGTIRMYDYSDDEENKKQCGQSTPPVYDMTSIPNNLPLFLSYGGADALSDVNDVQLLLANLKDHSQSKLVVQYQDNYAHADFVMGVNAKELVYDPLMAFFKQ
ncbi:hypothetical protein MKX03_023339 [Papaver bracteatum]|nr:hypothetical protein MKX03_023339 [Papaver bracteatum]